MKKILALGAIVAAVAFQGCEKKGDAAPAKDGAAAQAAEQAPAAPAEAPKK